MTNNWNQVFRYWALTLMTAGLIYLMWLIREFYQPLIVAALLAYIMDPGVELLAKRTPLSRTVVVTLVFSLALIALILIPIFLIPPIVADVEVLVGDLQSILDQVQEFIAEPIVILDQTIELESLLPDLLQLLSESVLALPENAFSILEATTKNILIFLVIMITTFYLLKDWDRLTAWGLKMIPDPYKADAQRMFTEIKLVWKGYLRGNLTLMAIVGVVFSIVWLALGVPGALILGVIIGLLTIIPDLGPTIGALLAVTVALFEGSTYIPLSNFWFAVLVGGIYLVLINIKNITIRPRIFGRSVHMHEGVVFVSIIIAVVVQGILGALIVIPLVASVTIVGGYIFRRIQGLEPFPEDAANSKGEGEEE